MPYRRPAQPAALRHVLLVTALSIACAFCAGCHGSATAARATVPAAPVPGEPWHNPAPAEPLDERPITPMESVGAADS